MFAPFDMHESKLKSLSSGMVANEDSGIECDNAEEVGERIEQSLNNTMLKIVTMKRADTFLGRHSMKRTHSEI